METLLRSYPPLIGNGFLRCNKKIDTFPVFSNGYSRCTHFTLKSQQPFGFGFGLPSVSVRVEAKKGKTNKKADTHSFIPTPDEAIGPFPEAVLLKQKKMKEDGRFLPEFADAEEEKLYESLNLELESQLKVDQMRHYEVVYLIHEKYAEEVGSVNEKVQDFLREKKGKIWRLNDWGMRRLAYKIQNSYKANYILMNIELGAKWINDFKNMLDKDERVIRHLVIKRKEAITEDCPPPPEYDTLDGEYDDEEDDDLEHENEIYVDDEDADFDDEDEDEDQEYDAEAYDKDAEDDGFDDENEDYDDEIYDEDEDAVGAGGVFDDGDEENDLEYDEEETYSGEDDDNDDQTYEDEDEDEDSDNHPKNGASRFSTNDKDSKGSSVTAKVEISRSANVKMRSRGSH